MKSTLSIRPSVTRLKMRFRTWKDGFKRKRKLIELETLGSAIITQRGWNGFKHLDPTLEIYKDGQCVLQLSGKEMTELYNALGWGLGTYGFAIAGHERTL